MRSIVSADIVIDHMIADETNHKKQIMSRFGLIDLDLSKTISFPEGLLGVVDKMDFCLANFPQPIYGNFKILQSVEDDNLSFIVLPIGTIDIASNYLHEEDLLEAINHLKISQKNALILLITSVHSKLDKDRKVFSQISVNMRAPLIIDSLNLSGNQYILYNDIYSIQHIVS